MKKVNLGCGSNRLEGWENYDLELDFSQPLPFENGSVKFIFMEHALEHIDSRNVFSFLKEVTRVLKKDGVIRIVVPSIAKIVANIHTPSFKVYSSFIGNPDRGWGGDSSLQGVVEAAITQHGHMTMFSEDLLLALCKSVGLDSKLVNLYESEYEELRNLEGHWTVVTKEVNDYESICVEARKIS